MRIRLSSVLLATLGFLITAARVSATDLGLAATKEVGLKEVASGSAQEHKPAKEIE